MTPKEANDVWSTCVAVVLTIEDIIGDDLGVTDPRLIEIQTLVSDLGVSARKDMLL